MTAQTAVAWAESQIGTLEEPPGSNDVPYWTYYLDRYGRDLSGQPWCGAFLIEALHEGGYDAPDDWVSVGDIEAWAKAHGRFRDGINGAQPGDVVLIGSFGEHVELASAVPDAEGLPCVGGNTSDHGFDANGGGVWANVRSASIVRGYVDMTNLYGAVSPAPAPAPKPAPTSPEDDPMALLPQIAEGCKNVALTRNVQALCIARGHALNIDGVFGPITTATVKAVQSGAHIAVDGIVGPHTWAALLAV